MSARTGGSILLQLLFDLTRAGGRADRVLDGPTSDVWIDPWVGAPARRSASTCGRGAPVEGIQMRGRADRRRDGRAGADGDRRPLRRRRCRSRSCARSPRPSCGAAEPRLKRARPARHALDERGHVLPRRSDVPIVNGHAIYIDSEWALTSISQRQFWRGVDFARLGDGQRRRDPLGRRLRLGAPGRAARQGRHRSARRDEIIDEVWAQLEDHLDGRRSTTPTSRARFLDPAIEFPNPTRGRQPRAAAGQHRRLVGATGPDAVTRIPNLFLASDYVRTYTDLATMEGANEAARRAVNGILDATRLDGAALRGLAAARAGGVRRPRARWTACAGSSSTGRPSRRCG